MPRASKTGSAVGEQGGASIVGRSRDQAHLHALLDQAYGGQGNLVLVSGAAGIGKTSLVQWLADAARRMGVRILEGYCYDLTVTPPYGPWLAALATIEPEHPLQTVLAPQMVSSQSILFDQVHDFLQDVTASQPALLILEDVHWSDPASLELLRYISRGVNALALMLIVTYRDDELAAQHPLARLLPVLVRESRAERVALQTLTDDDVRALVQRNYPVAPDDEARLVDYLQSRAEGNPFYLGEVLHTLDSERIIRPGESGWLVGELDRAPVPPLVRQVIEGRLAALDQETLRLLEIAAVVGQDVPLDIWQMASEAGRAQIGAAAQRAIDALLMQEMGQTSRVGFAHALVRDTLYHGQLLTQRQRHHGRIAEILAERPETDPSLVGSHFSRADDPRAIDWLIRAGERALVLYAAQDAVEALAQARELAVRFSGDLPLDAYLTRAAAHAMVGEFDRARRDYELVLDRSRNTADRQVEWQALVDLAALWSERDYQRAGRYCQAALDLAREINDGLTIAHSLNRVANWHANLDETDTAIRLHKEALSMFEERNDLEGIAGTLDLLGLVCFLNCELAESVHHFERGIELLRGGDDRQRLSSALVMLSCDGGVIDCDIAMPVYREPSFWIRSCEEGLEIARDIGWPAGEAYALWTLGGVTSIRGYLGRALTAAQRSHEIANRISHKEWVAASGYVVGTVWAELLDPDRAAAELEGALAASRVSRSRYWIRSTASRLAALHVETGDLDRAAAVLDGVMQTDISSSSMGQRQCWFTRARLELARGDPERALEILDRLSSPRPGTQEERVTPQIMALRGDALVRMGHLDGAGREYERARDILRLFEFRAVLWRIDIARAELFLTRGMPAEADEAIAAARATIDEIATAIPDEAIREHFCAEALKRLPALKASAEKLSPRELDVLQLLAEGRSDREIADALFISPRTVNRHVTAILNKTGVNTRTAAAALAIRHGLV